MKMYFKNLIFALAGALAMTACSNEMEEQLAEGSGNSGQEVKFTVGIENLSRTTIADGTLKTEFVKGDEIGIFAYDGENAVSSNVKYTYDGYGWTSDAAIAAQDGVQLSYYAYYPYNASVTDPSAINVTVNSDQATNGFSKDDVLTAKNTEAEAGATSVSLTFAHAMAMVQVGIKSGLTDDAEATVTLESIQPTALVNAKEATAVVSGDVTSIKMQKTSAADKWEYRAIVPAQEIASGSKLLTIVAGGKTYAVTYSSTEGQSVSYVAGEVLQITVNSLVALPEGEEVTIGGSITDWDASTSDPGEEDVTEVPTESLDLSALEGFDNFQTLTDNWSKAQITGAESTWFRREQNSGLVTYSKAEDNAISMTVAGTTRAYWNANSIGFHSGLKFDSTKKYTLTFEARAEGNRTNNNIGAGISNSDDDKVFCKSDLKGTLYTGGVTVATEYKSYTVTFDFSKVATVTKGTFAEGETYSSATSSDTDEGINIVFYNNTDVTKETDMGSSIIYVKNIKLEVVKE